MVRILIMLLAIININFSFIQMAYH